MAEQQQFLNVDPKIWKECAGGSFTVPKLHSKLYYFPIGHLENSPITPNTQTLSLLRPFILCTVSSVDFVADPKTDQIFAKLLLTPVIDASVAVPVPVEATSEEDGDGDHVVSYAKTLSISDANNGGGFSVPRACAKSIFPPLDLTTPSPSQELSITDVCGVVWTFRHVYRGNPKRYLFTTGWSPFVDNKQLVGGDTLVFIKNSAGNIFVGIRRKNMFAAANKITEKTVINAVELAKKNTPFEVVCYPRVDGFDFVVGDKVVEDSMKIHWYPGMRVACKVKNDNSSIGCSTIHGTISAISHSSTHPWRMLEVEWGEPKVSENLKRVSPWQVEPVFSIPLLYPQFPPTKRIRAAQGDSSISMEPMNQTLLNFDGILGVRQNHISGSNSSKSLKDSSFVKSSMVESDKVSTELNTTGHISDNHSILNSSGTNLTDIRNSNTEKVRPRSIILFGQVVYANESCKDDYAIKRADGGQNVHSVENCTDDYATKRVDGGQVVHSVESCKDDSAIKGVDGSQVVHSVESCKDDSTIKRADGGQVVHSVKNCKDDSSIKRADGGQVIHSVESYKDDSAIKQADGGEMRNKIEDTVKSIEKK